MMTRFFPFFLFFFYMLITVGCSDSNIEYTKQYVNIAKNISPKIPEGSKVALKMTSPDKNGLPEAFLQKLMAEFSGALVQSSDNKFVVLNRNSTEEIWQDAIEFNNQEIDSITSSAEADISISLSPKINESGIDLSVTVYSMKPGSTGNILASVTQLIPMNVKAELGVNVQTLDKKTDQFGSSQ